MIQKIKFYKERTGKWYVDLPEWSGEKENLEMIYDVGDLLEMLSQGENAIYIQIGDEKFPGSNPLILIEMDFSKFTGGWYHLPSYSEKELNFKIFIGEWIKEYFGKFPENLWFYKSF